MMGGAFLKIQKTNDISRLLDPNLPVERYFQVKGPEHFVTNRAREQATRGWLLKHWREQFPFQPEWMPWHPSYSLDSYLVGPPRYRHTVRLIDAAFARLYLEWARTVEADHRLAKRLFEEKLFEKKFFARKDLEAWLERRDFAMESYRENVREVVLFLNERLMKAKAEVAYRRWLEKLTDHEKYLSDLFAGVIEKRKLEAIFIGYEQLFTRTENGVIVKLPRHGRAMQMIWGDVYRQDIKQRMAKNFHWHASHRYMTTENGVIVPLPIMGKASQSVQAEISQEQWEEWHAKDLVRTYEKHLHHKNKYQQKLDALSLEKSRYVIKTINEYALSHKETLARIAKPSNDRKIQDLRRTKERESAKILRKEARDSAIAHQFEISLDEKRSTEIVYAVKEQKNEQLGMSLDEKIAARDAGAQLAVADHNAATMSPLTPEFDRPVHTLDELERRLSKVRDQNREWRDKKSIKDLQSNLASQAAGASSVLAQHVGQSLFDPKLDIPPQSRKKA